MSSETSTPYTPASASTTVAGNETTLADEVKKYNTEDLISFLRGQDLGLSDNVYEILENEEVDGRAFLKMTEQKFRDCGLKVGPAVKLADFAKECEKKKLRAFSTYKTKADLEKILSKYKVGGNDIARIPQFIPETEKIDDDDEELVYCINEIKRKMRNLGPITGKNEAVRCSYIEGILHASIFITKRLTEEKITLNPQIEIEGGEATGRVDFAIKKIIDVVNEELIAITEGKQKDLVAGFMQNVMQLESSYHTNTRKRKASEAFDEFDYLYGIVTTATDWHFLMYTPERIYCTKADYHIALTEDVLDNDKELRQGVKKVMEVIVGLLRDRVEVDDSPDTKRARTEKYIKE